MRLTKRQLVKLMAADTGLSQRKSSQVLESLLSIITNTIAAGEDIYLKGFGRLFPSVQNERKIKHPQTGRKIRIPSKKAVKFRCFKSLHYKVNGFDLDEFKIENEMILRQIFRLCRKYGDFEEDY